jgi:hypothetical protein
MANPIGGSPPPAKSAPGKQLSFAEHAARYYVVHELGRSAQGPEFDYRVFRGRGDKLIIHRKAEMPSICFLSGLAADTFVTRQVTWHHSSVYLSLLLGPFFYARMARILGKSQLVQFPLSDRGNNQIWYLQALGSLCLVLAFGIGIGGFFLVEFVRFAALPYVGLAAAGVFLVLSIIAFMKTNIGRTELITEHYAVIKGASKELLAQLPEWPYGNDIP